MNTDSDKAKMQFTLLRENHIIEKGISMRNTRKGFGQAKVSALINRLKLYNERYGSTDRQFLLYPLATVKEYIKFQNSDGIRIDDIETSFINFCHELSINPDTLNLHAGIRIETKLHLQTAARGDFSSLLYSRHSIRYFSDELPSKDLLEKALVLASRTPSACNRQTWHTHVYFNADSHELLKMQDGCRGFHDDIHCSIVVTADMKGFLGHEPFQCYIDGGLYAQNLINALHYVGLGSIPLSCGFMSHKLDDMKKRFDIPENEVMVVIIGVGLLTDDVKIAISLRKDIESTNRYHI